MFKNVVSVHRHPNVVVIGTWDSKGEILEEIVSLLEECGAFCIRVNLSGLTCSTQYKFDVDTATFVESVGKNSNELKSLDRPSAVATIKQGIIATNLNGLSTFKNALAEDSLDGVIGVGGTNGTDLVTTFMRGYSDIPSICLSTVAQHANHHFTQHHGHIYLVNSVTDMGSQLNSFIYLSMIDAVGALLGRIHTRNLLKKRIKIREKIAISQFGTTTPCVELCSKLLALKDYEICPFHMVGTGGKNMEALIRAGKFTALLEITPTEIADLYGRGIFSAGESRLSAAIEMKIPQVFVPGCFDMINLGAIEDVRQNPLFKNRLLHKCNDDVTVMRPTFREIRLFVQHMVEKFQHAECVVKIVLPLKGISKFDDPSNKSFPWYDPYANQFLFAEIKRAMRKYCKQIEVIEVDYHINDRMFAVIASNLLLQAIEENKQYHQSRSAVQNIKFFDAVTASREKGQQDSTCGTRRKCTF